jgi:hypothetical protein
MYREALAEVPFRIEVSYSDYMDAKVVLDGREEKVKDASTDDLLRVTDEAWRWPAPTLPTLRWTPPQLPLLW